MKELLKDKQVKKAILVLSVSGIIISMFLVFILNINQVNAFFKNLFAVLSPFIWGILFAIIAHKPASYIENKLSDTMPLKRRRFIGALVSTLILIVILVLVIALIVPKLLESIASLSTMISNYVSNPRKWLESIAEALHLSNEVANSLYATSGQLVQAIWNFAQEFIPNILSFTITTVSSLLNFIIGFIVCLYILIDRQRIAYSLKRVSSVLLNKKNYVKGREVMYLVVEKFTKFFAGKLLDSLIIGIICFVGMMFINRDYAVLIAVVVGITNIIPFFGPFIGAIPCTLILLIVKPIDALIFVIFIIILQQIDGNIIGPKILGDSVGLSSLWIVFAIVVGGAYFGFFGMLLGVPVFSVVYYTIKQIIDERYVEDENETA